MSTRDQDQRKLTGQAEGFLRITLESESPLTQIGNNFKKRSPPLRIEDNGISEILFST